jgi:NAD(P)-dependent dehydrogenase (short-subunit alcohol dehydrogenase family)
MSLDDLRAILEVNLIGRVAVTQAFLPVMMPTDAPAEKREH